MPSERFIAIDPGERVGWCTGTIVPAAEASPEAYGRGAFALNIDTAGVSGLKPFAVQLMRSQVLEPLERLEPAPYDHIIYETFQLSMAKAQSLAGSQLLTSQLIGMIRMAGWLSRCRLHGQGPDLKRMSMRSMPAELAARMLEHSEQHPKDAIIHAWWFYFDKYWSTS